MALTGCFKNDDPELKISDCSSEDEGNTVSRQHLPVSGRSAQVNITWSSDDEVGTENCVLNESFIINSAVTPVSRKYPSSARKSKLPNLSVKRKLNRSVETQPVARTVLSNINKPFNDDTNNKRSPWCKIRKTFSILRCPSNSPNIATNIEPKQTTPKKNQLPQRNSEDTSIEWSSSSSSSETNSPIRATNNGISTTQKSTAPTELELLVALVERENAAAKVINRATQLKQKKKRYLHGGYAERLQKLEEAKRIERNFLKHDQQLGLQQGIRMRVQKMSQAYGVHIAQVQLEENDNNIDNNDNLTTKPILRIVIDADMAAVVKEDSKIEAFFDTNIEPYNLQEANGDEKELIYVQPHKLLLL